VEWEWSGGGGGGGGGVIISDKETAVLFTTLGRFIVSVKVSRLELKMIFDLWL